MTKQRTPSASSAQALRRMRNTRQRDTACELALRRLLYGYGLRYRIHRSAVPSLRRKADIVFSAAKVAVFVDGCFWHSCPVHATHPKANGGWWADKLAVNRRRDMDTNDRFQAAGWRVERVWEHESPEQAALRIRNVVQTRLS